MRRLQPSLLSHIERPQVTCLNESSDHPVTNVLQKNGGFLESEADEQLLINLPVRSVLLPCSFDLNLIFLLAIAR
jgi:hypothetical protein